MSHDSAEAAQEVSAREYELRLVRLMREQLPAAGQGGGVVFVGPAELVRELVPAVLSNVVDVLSPCVADLRATEVESRARLLDTIAAADAWARTLIDCLELEAFSLDAGRSRVGALVRRSVVTGWFWKHARDKNGTRNQASSDSVAGRGCVSHSWSCGRCSPGFVPSDPVASQSSCRAGPGRRRRPRAAERNR